MFKANGRLSIKREGIVSNIRPGQDGSMVVTVDGDDYIVSSHRLINDFRKLVGKYVKIDGYASLGKLHISGIE